jgi:hypothetical protein
MFHSASKQMSEYEITFSSTVNIIKTMGGKVGVVRNELSSIF